MARIVYWAKMDVLSLNKYEALKKLFSKKYQVKSLYILAYDYICLQLRRSVTKYFEEESHYSLAENVSFVIAYYCTSLGKLRHLVCVWQPLKADNFVNFNENGKKWISCAD